MKTINLFVVIGALIVFGSGCASYHDAGHTYEGSLVSIGGVMWPSVQNEIVVINNTRSEYFIELRASGDLKAPSIGYSKSHVFGFNVFSSGGRDVPLTAIIYRWDNFAGETKVETNRVVEYRGWWNGITKKRATVVGEVVHTNVYRPKIILGMVNRNMYFPNSQGNYRSVQWVIEEGYDGRFTDRVDGGW